MAFLFRGVQHSKVYQKYRPEYPSAVYTAVLKYFDSGTAKGLDGDQLTPSPSAPVRRATALDLGCGTGISTLPLCGHFKSVIGVDASETQIEEARNAGAEYEGLSYRVGSAQDLGFQEDGSVDLITIAQALHWMDAKKFYPECNRVLRPGGILAAFGYGLPRSENPELRSLIMNLHDVILGDYWDPGRKHIIDCYRELYKDFSAAFPVSERDDSLVLEKLYSMDDFIGYLQSWSAYQAYRSKNPNAKDPLKDMYSMLKAIFSRSHEVETPGDSRVVSDVKQIHGANSQKEKNDETQNKIQFPLVSPIFILLARKN